METNRYDVVVVGAGLAGLTAAGAAADRKLKVALVSTGPGSFVTGPGWLKAQEMMRACAEPELSEAIAFFCEMARKAGCPFAGDISTAKYLPSLLGDFQSVAFAPLPLWNAEPRDGVSTAIVGIRGLSIFDENFMAERLSESARTTNSKCTYTARKISFARNLGIPVTTLRIAQCFDRDASFRAELIDALRLTASGFDRILVPGILGLDSSSEQIAQFECELGSSICEIPTLPPCIPGLRIFHRLESYLHKIGVELFRGFPVEKLEIHGGSSIGLCIANPGHPLNLRCDSVVLATGRHSAGLLGGAYAGHDQQMRSLTSTGSVMSPKLFVAGVLLDRSASDDGDVRHILTGYRAGKFAASTKGTYAAR
jgi:glycerol-3-phosphate dehydrogenase subunit B